MAGYIGSDYVGEMMVGSYNDNIDTTVTAPVFTHNYAVPTPQLKAMVRPPVVTHVYTGLVPSVAVSEILRTRFNNYLFVSVGDGMSTGDKIR
jgi:hypothetical protein